MFNWLLVDPPWRKMMYQKILTSPICLRNIFLRHPKVLAKFCIWAHDILWSSLILTIPMLHVICGTVTLEFSITWPLALAGTRFNGHINLVTRPAFLTFQNSIIFNFVAILASEYFIINTSDTLIHYSQALISNPPFIMYGGFQTFITFIFQIHY